VTKESDVCLKKINFGLANSKTILFDNINEGMQMFKNIVQWFEKKLRHHQYIQ